MATIGTTAGCPVCARIDRRGHSSRRPGYNHNETCRSRVITATEQHPEYRELMQTHEHGNSDDIEVMMEPEREERRGNVQKALQYIEERVRQERHRDFGTQLDRIMMEALLAHMDMAEFHGPQRVIVIARSMGLKVGWRLDFTIQGTDGRAWGFCDPEMRNGVTRRVLTDKPLLFIGAQRAQRTA